MEPMRYEAPESVDAAVSMLAGASGNARVLAGGTDLLVQLRAGMIEPALVVDIKHIEETRAITPEGGGFRVGSAVSGAELNEHDGVMALWPGVCEAVELIGSTQIQGRATLGGNLCNASPAGDTIPALIANAAICHIAGPNGQRELAVEDFVVGVGENALTADEVLLGLKFAAPAANTGDAYLRFIPRTEMDIAVVGAGVSVTLDGDGLCTAARVGIGAVAPTALLVPAAADALMGSTLGEAALAAAGEACTAASSPISDKRGTADYRRKVVAVLCRRAAKIAGERAKGSN